MDQQEALVPTRNDMRKALDSMTASVSAYALDGESAAGSHVSGEPERKKFVQGGDDSRDAELVERTLAEEVVFEGRIFNVNRIEAELPDGRKALRDVVRHPGAVAIVALTDDGRICLVRQWRTALERVTVEIPAGKLTPGEDPLECAERELREETGFVAERMAYLTTMATTVGFTDELIYLYMATGLSLAESSPDADEFINVDLVELDEVVDAVLDGKIEDTKTIVGALACDAIARRLDPKEN